jgi:hypothetical protein
MLFVALVYFDSSVKLEELQNRQVNAPYLEWMEAAIAEQSGLRSKILTTTLTDLNRRMNATDELLIIDMGDAPYCVANISEELVQLRGPRKSLTLRKSALRAGWSGAVLIISDREIVGKIPRGKARVFVAVASFAFFAVAWVVFRRLRSQSLG